MNFEKFNKIEERYAELEKLLADQEILADQSQYQKLAKEYSDSTPIITVFQGYKEAVKQKAELQALLKEKHDADFEELAALELEDLAQKQEKLLTQLNDLTNPKKQQEDRNLIFEIRAGTGGQEASLFAADLYRMYSKYADRKGWTLESISSHESETGGFKEVIFSISGKGAAKHLQWESGGHRVQRVPTTETQGRIHTSAATVAVMFEPEEVDVKIDPKDLKIDVFRSSGPGGQSVNTTDSAIRITHLPMGVVVICQDERSQLKNKYKAMRVLRARLSDKMKQEQFDAASQDRKLKVGSGDRSEKIRTYNFPDRRVTDHRIGFTTHKLNFVLDGDMDEITEALIKADQEDSLNDGK
ncbi:Peptide chain release factor 1 [hydrothermal vent metagenome]|uniref:Peptide chain release factor 1 n=1 Tax=hydrothermal vent metagenome TaxID=652676 RepID=A0A3B1DH10_9ZZZZ